MPAHCFKLESRTQSWTQCVNFGAELIALSTINAVTDFVLLVLPLPKLWRLHVSRTKEDSSHSYVCLRWSLIRIECGHMLSMYIQLTERSTIVVSIIRANYVSTLSFTNGTCEHPLSALIQYCWLIYFTGQNACGAMWSVVETWLAIVCAFVPTLRPLYEKMFGRSDSTTTGTGGTTFQGCQTHTLERQAERGRS